MSPCADPFSSVSWIRANMTWEPGRNNNNELIVQLAARRKEQSLASQTKEEHNTNHIAQRHA